MAGDRYRYRVLAGSTRSCEYYRLDDAMRFARSLGARIDHRRYTDEADGSRVWLGYETMYPGEAVPVARIVRTGGAS